MPIFKVYIKSPFFIQKNVNIDKDTHKITHESLKNTYWFLLGPAYNRLDISPNLSSAIPYYTAESTSGTIATIESYTNLKITYYDL